MNYNWNFVLVSKKCQTSFYIHFCQISPLLFYYYLNFIEKNLKNVSLFLRKKDKKKPQKFLIVESIGLFRYIMEAQKAYSILRRLQMSITSSPFYTTLQPEVFLRWPIKCFLFSGISETLNLNKSHLVSYKNILPPLASSLQTKHNLCKSLTPLESFLS